MAQTNQSQTSPVIFTPETGMAPRFGNTVNSPSPLFTTSWQCGGVWQGIITIPIVGVKAGVPFSVSGSAALNFPSPLSVGSGITMVTPCGASLNAMAPSGIIIGSLAAWVVWGNSAVATLSQGTYTSPKIMVSATVFAPTVIQGTTSLQVNAWAELFGSKGS